MNIRGAVKAMRAEKSVCRPSWVEGTYLFTDGMEPEFVWYFLGNATVVPWVPTAGELRAKDWIGV